MKPTISVIMPIYNAANHMSESINSVLNQTFKDMELILVNDGSTDGSKKICDNYAALDDRIQVIHQKNQGVSEARNTGINRARGKYINFIDADDTIESHTYELLIKYAQVSDYDLIIYGMHFDYYNEGFFLNTKTEKIHSNIILERSQIRQEFFYLYQNNYLSPIWNKLFKASLIKENRIYFNSEMAILEDLNYTLEVLNCVDEILVIPDALYHYYNDISESLFTRRPNIDYMNNFKILDSQLRKVGNNLGLKTKKDFEKINNIILRSYITYLEYIFHTEITWKEKYIKTAKFINDKEVKNASHNTKYEKSGLILINLLIKNKMKLSLFILMTGYNFIKNYKRRKLSGNKKNKKKNTELL